MDTIFTVKNEHLERLSPEQAVNIFRELLWAEATSIGIAKTLINVPSAINVKDGGIDAESQGVEFSGGQGIFKKGLTRYQIKTGEFSLSQTSKIKKILLIEKSNELKPRIKSCFEKNGTLIVVLFGWDNPEVKDDAIKEKFHEVLADINPQYADVQIEIWRQNNLISFISIFPSLALRVNGNDRTRFESHYSWSRHDDMLRDFKAGEEQKKFVENLRNELRSDDNAIHLRVWGEPGIGKTKLVLEATRANDLATQVIYCDSAAKFRDSVLINEILKEDNKFVALLVIDECDQENRAYIWNKLRYCGSRIKLVTIYNEFDDTAGEIAYYDTPALDEGEIIKIIQDYGIPKDHADRWAEFCSGSPRAAHIIGSNLKTNPDDLLKSPATVNAWVRYITGGDVSNSQIVQQRRTVLLHISLFKRFGFGRPLLAEAKAISDMVVQADNQITWARFQEIVRHLKSRKILQGENTLYISPKLLHIWLWSEWWKTYGASFEFEEFSESLPQKLREWFYEMFSYASESQAAVKVVNELLGPEGPFQRNNFINKKLSANFFLALTVADSKAALRCLKNTVGTWDKDELLKFETGRREVIWALERIAVWRPLFPDAARILLSLAEAENETWSNNATGIFQGLFSLGPDRVAPTEAPPEERFPVLKEAVESPSKERRLIGLKACDEALESQRYTKMLGPERQGLKQQPNLWKPKTYGEIFDAYRRVWNLIFENLDTLEKDEQQEGIGILLQRFPPLLRFENLQEMVFSTIFELSEKPYADKNIILERIVKTLHYWGKNMSEHARQRLEEFKNSLTSTDYKSLMNRYVKMDLLVDNFNEKGDRVDQAQPFIEQLVSQTLDDPSQLEPELVWLMTHEAKNGYRFGYQLGRNDKGFSLLGHFIETQRKFINKPGREFLGGYFRALFEGDIEQWETVLDELAEDDLLNKIVPELTWRSGLTNRAALRFLHLALNGIIRPFEFSFFGFGRLLGAVSEEVFEQWVEFLLKDKEQDTISVLLDLYYYYYIVNKKKADIPKEMTFKILTHPSLFMPSETRNKNQMVHHNWRELGLHFVKRYPDESLNLADVILDHFGEDNTILEGYHSNTHLVLNEIVKKYPAEICNKVTSYLNPPYDSRAFHLTHWLRGGEYFKESNGILPLIPSEEIWKWVDEDVEKRAWYLATFVPKTLHRGEGICFARELLIRYGDRKDVRNNLIANFSSEGWSGSESAHYHDKKQRLMEFLKDETNENVKRWLNNYIEILEKEIERAKIEEERDYF